jgi:ribose/xylose/arabinose/galactoside ABC-type transport system permease subunit
VELKKYRQFVLPIVCIVGFITAGSRIPNYMTLGNILNVIRQSSIVSLVSYGMAMVIIAKGIDLSSGGLIAFCAMVGGLMMKSGVPMPAAIFTGILCGALMGFFSGIMVENLEVPAFITTLVVGQVATGFALMLGGGNSLGGFSDAYVFIGNGKFLGIPISNYITLFFVILSSVIMHKTRLGTYIYALGGNMQVVRQQGISTAGINYFVFAFSGICASVAGILLSAQMNTVHPSQGGNYQLDAVAACVIGGVNMAGGEGKVYMALVGALVIGFLRNALNLIGLHPYYQNLIVGFIIITVVAVSIYNHNKKLKTARVF